MKCTKCSGIMREVKVDESQDTNVGKVYTRTIYHCEKDDVWIVVEVPKS